MPRQRSAPSRASASSAASRPRPTASPAASSQPAASGGGWFGSKAPASPPPAAAARPVAAQPPMMQQQSSGGGIMSGLMGSMVTGAAMGTGSAVAHRAVDSMMGPREMTVNHENNHAPAPPAPAVPMPAASMAGSMNPCEERVREFADCMTRANGDMGACQFYFESMNTCKMQNRMA